MDLQCLICKLRYGIKHEARIPIYIVEGMSMCTEHVLAWMRYLDYIGYARPLGKARLIDYDIRSFSAWLERGEK